MVEIPITILNSDLIEQYKSNGQIIYPYVSFSPHSVSGGTPTQACPASYKTHPVNTVKVDADNYQYEVEIPRGLAPFQVKTIWLFDQEDQLLGYASVDLPYLGSAKLSVRLLINYTGWPGADPWENMEQMVTSEINTLETWKANAEDIQNGIPRLWDREIYVDQVNGDDENPGTSDAPVQSLQKAIEMIPVGGFGSIVILGVYTLKENIIITKKDIQILLKDGSIFTTQWHQVGDNVNPYYVYISDSKIEVRIDTVSEIAKLIFPPNNTGYPENLNAFFIAPGSTPAALRIVLRNRVDGNVIEIHQGTLMYCGHGSIDRLYNNMFALSGHYIGSILVKTGAKLVDFRGATGSYNIKLNTEINIINENGEQITPSELVEGIIYDINGIPRNILSTMIL